MPEIVQELLSMKVDTTQLLEALNPLLLEGYALNLTYDATDSRYTARLAGVNQSCVNAGKLLYANGQDIKSTLLALYGKHFLVSRDGVWEGTQPTSSVMS
jgi:hypothetical protein